MSVVRRCDRCNHTSKSHRRGLRATCQQISSADNHTSADLTIGRRHVGNVGWRNVGPSICPFNRSTVAGIEHNVAGNGIVCCSNNENNLIRALRDNLFDISSRKRQASQLRGTREQVDTTDGDSRGVLTDIWHNRVNVTACQVAETIIKRNNGTVVVGKDNIASELFDSAHLTSFDNNVGVGLRTNLCSNAGKCDRSNGISTRPHVGTLDVNVRSSRCLSWHKLINRTSGNVRPRIGLGNHSTTVCSQYNVSCITSSTILDGDGDVEVGFLFDRCCNTAKRHGKNLSTLALEILTVDKCFGAFDTLCWFNAGDETVPAVCKSVLEYKLHTAVRHNLDVANNLVA